VNSRVIQDGRAIGGAVVRVPNIGERVPFWGGERASSSGAGKVGELWEKWRAGEG
jgi:hypothetical protein